MKNKSIIIRVTEDEYNKLKQISSNYNMTMSGVIRYFITLYDPSNGKKC